MHGELIGTVARALFFFKGLYTIYTVCIATIHDELPKEGFKAIWSIIFKNKSRAH